MSDPSAEGEVKVKRRQVLGGIASTAAITLAPTVTRAQDQTADKVFDPTRVQGAAAGPQGARSKHSDLKRYPVAGIASLTPLEDLTGTLTPADLHFERHHAGIPEINPEQHEVVLHGLVERPLTFSLDELKRFPAVTRTCFIECSGNYFPRAGEKSPPHMICGLTSQSEWTGVPLVTLLREAGVRDTGRWLLAEGGDAAVMTRSIPMAKALDDVLVVYGQNGEPLRPAQGYPLRLLVPGWEGNTNVKWLRRLEVLDTPAMTREETSKYTEPMLDGSIRQFSFDIEARSIITSPSYPGTIEPGWQTISGLAWSGKGKIRRVEISTDGGDTWQAAQLQGPVLAKAHTRFQLPWRWQGEETLLMSRAIDETGYQQPTLAQIFETRGPGSGPYHFNPITGWRVQKDGELRFTPTG